MSKEMKFRAPIYKQYEYAGDDDGKKTRLFKCLTCSLIVKVPTTSNLIGHLETNF